MLGSLILMHKVRAMVRNFISAFIVGTISTTALSLTWKDLVQSTQENSSELKALNASQNSQLFKTKEARSPYSPEASFTQKYLRRFSDQGSKSYSASSLEVTQNIFSGFKDIRNAELTDLALKKQNFTSIKVKADLTERLKRSAAEFVYSTDLQKLNQEIEVRLKNNFQLVTLRFDVGRENKGSVLLSEAALKEASYELQLSKYQRLNAEKSLSVITGLPSMEGFDGKIPLAKPPSQINVESIISTIPAVQEFEFDYKIAEKKTAIARSQFYPRVDLNFKKSLASTFPSEEGENSTISLVLTVPLFSGLSTYYSTRSLIEEETSLGYSRFDKTEKLKDEISRAYQDLVNAYALLNVNESYEKAMKLRSKIAESKYSNGLIKFDEWNDIEKELILKQKSLLGSRKNITLAQAHFDNLLGLGEF